MRVSIPSKSESKMNNNMIKRSFVYLGVCLFLFSCDAEKASISDEQKYAACASNHLSKLSFSYQQRISLREENDSLYSLLQDLDKGVAPYRDKIKEYEEWLLDLNFELIDYSGGYEVSGAFAEPCEMVQDFFIDPEVKDLLDLFFENYENFVREHHHKNIIHEWEEFVEFKYSAQPDLGETPDLPGVFFEEDMTMVEAQRLFMDIHIFIMLNEHRYYIKRLKDKLNEEGS